MLKTTTLFAAAILAVNTLTAQDVKMVAVTPLSYQVPGKHQFRMVFEYVQPVYISNYTVQWQVNNGPVQTLYKTGKDVKSHSERLSLTDPAMVADLPAAGNYAFKAWVKATVPADLDASNDTLKSTIRVHNTLPKKNVVLEVFKHTTCGPCYPAAVYLDTLVSKNPMYSIVNIYDGTPADLGTAEGMEVDNHYAFGHPTALADRFTFPYRGGADKGFWGLGFINAGASFPYRMENYGEREEFLEALLVAFKNVQYNDSTRELKVTVVANFLDQYPAADYRFNLYITEDSVKAYQASAPSPYNYYHKRVLRAMLGGAWGLAGSLPASIKKGDRFEKEFTYTLPAGHKPDKTRLVAMVQTYDANDKKRFILNSEQTTLREPVLSVPAMQAAAARIYPNPAKDKLAIDFESGSRAGYTLTLTDMAGRICRSLHCQDDTTIDIGTLPAGSYLLRIDDGKVVHTQRVIKE